MSPAAARMSWPVAPAAPIRMNPGTAIHPDCRYAPRLVSAAPSIPITNPLARTGTRPIRSINRPAGNEVNADETRESAGPSPRRLVAPVTSAKVSADTADTNWSVAEFTATAEASKIVLRRIGRFVTAGTRCKKLLRRESDLIPRATPGEKF